MTAFTNELRHMYDIIRSGNLEDRMQYSPEDFVRMYPGCNGELMVKLVELFADRDQVSSLRVLRVIAAWSPAEIDLLNDLFNN
jgi:hypothetical protein